MELVLSLEFVRVVEEAAIAAARAMGEGNAHALFSDDNDFRQGPPCGYSASE